MKAYDAPTAVNLGAGALQVAQGSTVDDANGQRQAVLMFEPGTDAVIGIADGSTKPLGDDLEVRNQFTVGSGGDEAMPGELPPEQLHVCGQAEHDSSAVEAGATRRHLRQAGRFLRRQLPRIPQPGRLCRPRTTTASVPPTTSPTTAW